MSVESSAPANARTVYTLLIALGVVSAVVGAILVGIIVYNYVTRIELREPGQNHAGISAPMPAWLITS
jgi:hypothetical protein